MIHTDLDILQQRAESTRQSRASIASPAPTAPSHKTESYRVRTSELQPNMYLAKDIRLKDGTLLLSTRHILHKITINLLQEMASELESDYIWIMPSDLQK